MACIVTFEDGHVDVGANLWDVAELSSGRLVTAALCWLQVVTAVSAGERRSTRRRHQGHRGSEGPEEEDTQHFCTYGWNRGNDLKSLEVWKSFCWWVWISGTG